MRLYQTLYMLLFVVVLVLYGMIMFWSMPQVMAEANGLRPLDLRPMGYGFDEAVEFMAALSEDGRHFYLGTQQVLDTAYPLALAAWLAWSLSWALGFAPQIWRTLAMIMAISVLFWENLENRSIAVLLQTKAAEIDPGMVATASQWTLVKSIVTTICFVLLIGAAIWRVRHVMRQNKA